MCGGKGLLCCFCCVTACGCRNVVCRKVVFFPPKPMYSLEEKKRDDGEVAQVMWLMDENRKPMLPYSSRNFMVEFVQTRRKQRIAVCNIRFPRARRTILFSHGNASDIGAMRDHLIDLALQLEVSVCIYDYTGYGLSSGKATAKDVHSDADAAFDYLKKKFGLRTDEIILYGQSLGSAPTIYLATKHRVQGVVLHSPLMSAIRVIRDTNSTKWFDVFPNIDRVRDVRSPVFVIHGDADEDITIAHGQGLYEAAPNKYEPWWVPGAGHNNIEVSFRAELFRKLRAFMAFIAKADKGGAAAAAAAGGGKKKKAAKA